jgi:hypothetical protein
MRKTLIIGLLATPKMALAALLLHVLEGAISTPMQCARTCGAISNSVAEAAGTGEGSVARPRPPFDPEIRLCLPDPHGHFTRDTETVREAIVGQWAQ